MQTREKTISRVTIWGAVANLALSAAKFVSGILGHSSAMLADATHSLSDLLSDFVVLVMLRFSSRESDADHDYGHGKYETLASVFVSLMLIVVGAKLMAEGVGKIRLAAGGGVLDVPEGIALWAALLSIVVKEVLYQWTAHVGKRINSPAMISNAWHHRSDALSSVGAAMGIGGAMLFGGKWVILDPIAGCILSIFIIVIAVKMIVPAVRELTEESLPEDMERRMESIVSHVPGVRGIHELKTRRIGPGIGMDAHVLVDPDISVRLAHSIMDEAEKELRREFGEDTQISLHVEPDEEFQNP